MKWLLFLLLFLPLSALADIRLLQWKPADYDYAFLLPQKEGETPESALQRLLNTLEANPELHKYAAALKKAETETFKTFTGADGPSVLAISNDVDDLVPHPERMHQVLDPLAIRGASPILLPVAATAGLSEKEAQEFRKKVNANFDGLFAVGGDDIHPSLYNDADAGHLTEDTNLSRDVEELKLVRAYLEESEGMFAAMCRGHEMGGVASDCQLIKDIKKELQLEHPVGKDHKIIKTAQAGPLTTELFADDAALTVKSLHHESVIKPNPSNPRVKVTAVAEGQPQISEVLEYRGRRGLSAQTHPEIMASTDFHKRFYDLLFGEMDRAYARRTKRPFSRIDLKKTLIGIEYTFQDQGMVDEPGRLTYETPHKRERFDALLQAYLKELGLKENSVMPFGSPDFKPGNTIDVPGDGKHVLDMEPVTIEVNANPRHFDEIDNDGKIFNAAVAAKLVAYVNPAAERSGMGHIHLGGQKLGDSPFYLHPHLLRNLMAYELKHPSVLWGFAEAYDIDDVDRPMTEDISNIQAYHRPKQQEAFARAVNSYDEWYLKTLMQKGDLNDGLRQFLMRLKKELLPPPKGFFAGLFSKPDFEPVADFFHHYRFFNLEHLLFMATSSVPVDPELTGKLTVEPRNFRPPRTIKHAKANAELLLTMMERFSEPGYLVKVESISPDGYDRFYSATAVAADWDLVKRDLPRYNPLWDESVNEYVQVQLAKKAIKAQLPGELKAEIFPAYSPQTKKGSKYELRIPVTTESPPKMSLVGKQLSFARVQIGLKEYWLSTFNIDPAKGFTVQEVETLENQSTCGKWFSAISNQ